MKTATIKTDSLPQKAFSDSKTIVRDFARRGMVLLSPESLEIPLETHQKVFDEEMQAKEKQSISIATVPTMAQILNAPGLVKSVEKLVGKNWAIVPFAHTASFESGGSDQMWHKDDVGPYNGRRQRHHQSIQLEMLYYPQDVTPEMGPTATMPYAHYWAFNHEENNDNFAGADHLDFRYMLSGMEGISVSGKNSEYAREDIVNATTAHDKRMEDAVKNTGWPLVQQFQVAPIKAGSVVLYSHNTFHRGNHRRDHYSTWADNPRFMWRFYIYRTTDSFSENDALEDGEEFDHLINCDLSNQNDDIKSMWRYHEHWLNHGNTPKPLEQFDHLTEKELKLKAETLYQQMLLKEDRNEAKRIGAAYTIAGFPNKSIALEILNKALYVERENVRRAASYGLVALGSEATENLLKASGYPVKWVRKAAVFGLGSVAKLNEENLKCLLNLLKNDASLYVRSVCADSIGCLFRRAIAKNENTDLIPNGVRECLKVLKKEENRISANILQKRSIKLTRPTDDADVCEGNGIILGQDRFDPVRSLVRENLMWSLVMICSHGEEILGDALPEVIETMQEFIADDKNIFIVGFAMDVLNRLTRIRKEGTLVSPHIEELKSNFKNIIETSPILPWDTLVKSGLEVYVREKQ